MNGAWILAVAAFAAASLISAQPQTGNPAAASSPVEIKGKIEKIQIARGQGMPSLEVATREGRVTVLLGSMRYLMEQDFNPKAGDEITVRGFRVNDSVLAATVSLSATGKTLRLRDDSGRPVWTRGRYGPPMNKPGKR